MNQKILRAFPRASGKWGIRNHILILPLHSALSSAARQITESFTECVSVSHDWSGEADSDLDRIKSTLSGFASNPNLFATIYLTIGTSLEEEIIHHASNLGQNNFVEVSLARAGSFDQLLTEAFDACRAVLAKREQQVRVEAPFASILLGLECGGSDALSGITANPALGIASDRIVELGGSSVLGETTEILGAEHLLAARALDTKVGEKIISLVARYESSINYEGIDIRGAQPSRGNIEGGLSTLEEKSLGATKKAGKAPFTGTLEFGERLVKPGLYFMDTPGHDIEQLTGFAAGHLNIVVFTTGRGTPTGSPIMPTIKVSTNTQAFDSLRDLIDLDAGTIADGLRTLGDVGNDIFNEILDVVNGKLTKAEINGHGEFSLSRMYGTKISRLD